ncbi:MAG: hypothetical protein QGF16_15090 [Rhodospirillales bacterium]|nr:hypothetical protein [Rhodospirillales bacterium]
MIKKLCIMGIVGLAIILYGGITVSAISWDDLNPVTVVKHAVKTGGDIVTVVKHAVKTGEDIGNSAVHIISHPKHSFNVVIHNAEHPDQLINKLVDICKTTCGAISCTNTALGVLHPGVGMGMVKSFTTDQICKAAGG